MLKQYQIDNMVNQFLAQKHIDKNMKEKYFKLSDKFVKIIYKLSLDIHLEKRLLIWLLEQTNNKTIVRITEDSKVLTENLKLYFKNKHSIHKELSEITYSDLKQLVLQYKKKRKSSLNVPITKNDEYEIYEITNVKLCTNVAKGTSWCVQGKQWAKKYLKLGPLYLVQKNNHRFALLSFETAQFMDVNDLVLDEDNVDKIFNLFNNSEDLLLKAIRQDGLIIRFIKIQSEKIKLEAVKNNALAIKYIENPSEELQLLAVTQCGFAIRFLNNASEKVKLAAVNQIGDCIQHIDNPSEQVQLNAVSCDGTVLSFIKNPTKKVMKKAVQVSGHAIKWIKNPDEDIQIEAIKASAYSIADIENPTEKAQIVAVKRNCYVVFHIKNPCEEAQIISVKSDPSTIQSIQNPCEEAQMEAVKQDVRLIKQIKCSPARSVVKYVNLSKFYVKEE
jgi:hypothetical protein